MLLITYSKLPKFLLPYNNLKNCIDTSFSPFVQDEQCLEKGF